MSVGTNLRKALGATLGLFLLGLAWGSPATAASTTPLWNVEVHHAETNFKPGGKAEYWIELFNVGDVDSSGPVSVTVDLPAGITFDYARVDVRNPSASWQCPALPGDQTVTCTFERFAEQETVRSHLRLAGLTVGVDIAPSASGVLTTAVTAEGGGGEPVTEVEPTPIDAVDAGWGLVPHSFVADFFEEDGLTPVRQAGEHPDLATFEFDLNTVPYPGLPEPNRQRKPFGDIRHVTVELPPGFVGNPTAVDECAPPQLLGGTCPPASQVGRVDLTLMPVQPGNEPSYNQLSHPVYNMNHPRGAITDLAFTVQGNPVHIKATLDPSEHYAVETTVSDVNETLPLIAQKLTLWGVPADPSHDMDHCANFGFLDERTQTPCPPHAERKAFLTVPAQCEEPVAMRIFGVDSWENTGQFAPELTYPEGGAQYTGCELLRFNPDVALHPTGKAANTPTGLDIHVKVPQSDNPNGLGTPPIKKFEVRFPEGMSVSPSFADGLTGCSLAQMGLGTNDPAECPGSSRIGSVTLATPLLPEPLEGSMYLSNQKENPFGATFGMYLVVHDTEERGVLIKMPGRLDLDEQTGRITTSFDDLPQFPAEDLTLEFRSGPRAPLVSPPTCGKKTITVEVASWAQPDKPVDVSNSYDVSEGPNGTACPPDPEKRPFSPTMEAGSVDPNAGGFSPFVFRTTRGDQDQELSQISTALPKGLTSRIADVSECSDAALASISSEEGTARRELQNPACPASSRLGSMDVGMGSGTGPTYFPGKVYLAGPYKGAPLSLAFVVPAIAGPFDFGSVVVRAAVHVDPVTTQVRVESDRFPTILHGVLLRVRDVRVKMDRDRTMRNPTSCAEKWVDARITGVGAALDDSSDDAAAHLSDRFKAVDCISLGFKPKLSLRLKGGTHRGDYPALIARVRPRAPDADIEQAVVTLPHSEFLAQEHIRTVCTRVQFAAQRCPADSVYGTARAVSPLLAEPLEGPVYLRSSNHPLPDIVVALNGRVDVTLSGRVDSRNGGIRVTFENLPDVPVTSFEMRMKGGKKGLLVNSRNICEAPSRAASKMTGHNGRRSRSTPPLRSTCKKKRG
jgi:hypothetical protein